MIWLLLGVLLWSGAHLLPSAGASQRARLIERLGQAYQGLFALTILVSMGLMIFGWRSTVPSPVYGAPGWSRTVAPILVFGALFLFAVAGLPSNFKRLVRHPQLTAVATWSVAHLVANGDLRSLVLFGGLGAWAIVAIHFINRRDGAWQKPDPLPMAGEWKPLVGAIVVFGILHAVHVYIAGVPAPPQF
ncbi:MAG: NnrU protein [bacterium]|nr:NnrU protein [bacterium]